MAEDVRELDLHQSRQRKQKAAPVLAAAANEQVTVLDFKAQVQFLPDSTRLTCRTDLTIRHLKSGTEPLFLYFDALSLDSRVDSVLSVIGIDSMQLYVNYGVMLIYQGQVEAGQVDTLTFWFKNKTDFRGYRPLSQGPDRFYHNYYGIFYWSPFPAEPSFAGAYKVSFDITAPQKYQAVAMGELERTWEPSPGLTCFEWRTKYPAKDTPIFVVDKYQVKTYEREARRFNIYHLGAPDSLLDRRAEWQFEAWKKYETWFGGIEYQTVNMVELTQWSSQTTPYFSLPGTFFVPEGHLGGENYIIGNSPYLMQKSQVHELAHQWWAHRVWSPEHLYTMEGWAEYSALRVMWPDKNELKNRYRNNLQKALKTILGTEADQPLVDVQPTEDRSLYYLKGPWVLYMLESMLGEDAFIACLKEYQTGFPYQENSLTDFFSILERSYGRDLGWFRREWFEKAGYPQVRLRSSYRKDGESLSGRLVLEQTDGLFDIPVELGVYPPGQAVPELTEIHLAGKADTVTLSLAAIPDSIRLDPGVKTLMDVTYQPQMALAPQGVAPGGQSHRLELYLDSSSIYRDATLFYRAGGADWDSVRILSPGAPGGFLGLDLPPQNAGVEVEYYIRVTNGSGLEFNLPESAPDSVARLEFKALPRPGRRALAGFEPRKMDPPLTHPSEEEIFPAQRAGLLCFNPEDLSVFGILYGAGNLAPVVDSEQKKCYCYNWFTNTIDVVDLDSWAIERKIPVPEGVSLDYSRTLYSLLDEDYNALYLLDWDCLYRVDLASGAFRIIAGQEGGTTFAIVPMQLELYPGKDILLLKNRSLVQLYSRSGGGLLREIEMDGTNEFPTLLSDSVMLTAELYINPTDYFSGDTRRRYLVVRRYDISSDKPVLLNSSVSRGESFSFPTTMILGAGSTKFLDGGNTLVAEVEDTVTALLIWDWTRTDSVARFAFDYEKYHSNSVYRSSDKGRLLFTLSGDHNCLALIDLDAAQVREPFYSPYTGETFSSPPMYGTRLMWVITPAGDRDTGDVDGNGRADVYDLLAMLHALGNPGGSGIASFDLNSDGKLDVFDLLGLLKLLK
ncbi:hypothetical protein LLH00_12790 [bacterium]|nr:hypothetical protein [bacterium]